MALNSDKSETILLGTRQRAHSHSSLVTVNVAGSHIPLADHIKILGVTLDKNLSMNNHVNTVCKSIHYHIRALRHIHSSISEDMAKMCALVGSRLDYANSVLFGATQKKNIFKLQKAQNLLARVVTCSPQSCSPRTLLQQLYWLPVKHRIDFKIANITLRRPTLHFSQPTYLRSSLHACHSTRSRRLSNTNLLSAPFVRTSFGSHSFSVAAPKIWNSLPPSLRTCTSPDTFRCHVKIHYCQQAFLST